jgi:hypothetical protein
VLSVRSHLIQDGSVSWAEICPANTHVVSAKRKPTRLILYFMENSLSLERVALFKAAGQLRTVVNQQ